MRGSRSRDTYWEHAHRSNAPIKPSTRRGDDPHRERGRHEIANQSQNLDDSFGMSDDTSLRSDYQTSQREKREDANLKKSLESPRLLPHIKSIMKWEALYGRHRQRNIKEKDHGPRAGPPNNDRAEEEEQQFIGATEEDFENEDDFPTEEEAAEMPCKNIDISLTNGQVFTLLLYPLDDIDVLLSDVCKELFGLEEHEDPASVLSPEDQDTRDHLMETVKEHVIPLQRLEILRLRRINKKLRSENSSSNVDDTEEQTKRPLESSEMGSRYLEQRIETDEKTERKLKNSEARRRELKKSIEKQRQQLESLFFDVAVLCSTLDSSNPSWRRNSDAYAAKLSTEHLCKLGKVDISKLSNNLGTNFTEYSRNSPGETPEGYSPFISPVRAQQSNDPRDEGFMDNRHIADGTTLRDQRDQPVETQRYGRAAEPKDYHGQRNTSKKKKPVGPPPPPPFSSGYMPGKSSRAGAPRASRKVSESDDFQFMSSEDEEEYDGGPISGDAWGTQHFVDNGTQNYTYRR